MINLRISGVPALDRNGQLVGIITEGDLLRRAETGTERRRSRWSHWFSENSRLAADYVKSYARRVEDVMTREVVTVGELTSLEEIAGSMESKGIKRVPVMDDDKIVGIVSRADLLQVLASGGAPREAEDSDRFIRERLLAELRQQDWARARPRRISSSRMGSFISGVRPNRTTRERRCGSSPKTYPVSAALRTT